jgi:predicted ATPase
MTRGWTAPEVEHSLDRAVALCDSVGDDRQRARAFYGMQSLYLVQARLEKVELVSQELQRLYQRTQQSPPPLESEMMLTGSRLHLGRITEASEQFERALALNDPSQVERIADEQGWNFAVHGRAWWAHALWLLGRADTALVQGLEAMRLADALGQPFNQSVAATYLALLQQLCGDAATARRAAEKALAVTTESRAPYYRAWSEILVRNAEATSHPDAATVGALRASIEVFRVSGARLRLPYYLGLLAGVCRQAGRAAEGLAVIDEALAMARTNNERWWDAELHRLRGDLRLAAGAGDDEAAAAYLRALEIARTIGARSLELRAATSLARLRRSPAPLAELIHTFGEGRETPDHQAAQALLSELTQR